MKTLNDFQVGQRVKMYDREDGCNVYGHVLEVKPNDVKRLQSVVIKWGDINDPCEHYFDEFKDITTFYKGLGYVIIDL